MRSAKLVAAATLLVLSTVVAAGAPATAERDAHLRSGPGTGYRIVGTLPRGTTIDVNACTDGWCEVPWRGSRTYVAQSLLALPAMAPAPIVAPGPRYESDDYPGFDFPSTAYAPAVGVTALPRWSNRRWSSWRHRYGRAWTQRFYGRSNGGTRSTERSPPGQGFPAAAVRGASEPMRPAIGSADPTRPVPPLAIPAPGATSGTATAMPAPALPTIR